MKSDLNEALTENYGKLKHRRTSQKKFGGNEVLPKFVTFAHIMIF